MPVKRLGRILLSASASSVFASWSNCFNPLLQIVRSYSPCMSFRQSIKAALVFGGPRPAFRVRLTTISKTEAQHSVRKISFAFLAWTIGS
ncbi:uncharacterized protein BYT42DRAFT_135231 [Radiomyces spectabilis]|uniref:uncharacterized protein n=1 Tax=Radiomyces spectabilis TaxID=64574 RepID=UPI00221E5C13|nr:uncharacterized protein BYT42DRAFT_135231 [Radiomyces spectabilis]KAI8367679.1 hypothetical protein BYT42DRAFT_135231 [Radiomyces spectabilis]